METDILRYLGDIKRRLGQLSAARKDLERAVEIGKNVYGSADWHLALIYNLLGDVLYDDPETSDQALDVFQQARQICENTEPRVELSDLHLAYSYRGIGQSLQKKKDFAGALEYLNKALKLRQQYLDPSSPSIANIYQYLGVLGFSIEEERFNDVGIDYSTSKEYVEKSLLINIQVYGLRSYEVTKSLDWISLLSYASQNIEDRMLALKYREEETQIRIEILGHKSEELVRSHYWKGRILEKLDRNRDAIDAYKSALSIGQNLQGTELNWIRKSQDRLQQLEVLSSTKL